MIRYLFLDEGGNFDFSEKGSKVLTMTATSVARDFLWEQPLLDLRYRLLEAGDDRQEFHASEDKQNIRNAVFDVIQAHIGEIEVHAVIVEKRKAHPSIQKIDEFYPRMLKWLLKYILTGFARRSIDQVIVITDEIPVNKKRKAVEKGIKTMIRADLPEGTAFNIFHHDSSTSMGLQVVDYVNWAIYRKWNNGDKRSYDIISRAIRSEFDVFARGEILYY